MSKKLKPFRCCGSKPHIIGNGIKPSYGTVIQCIKCETHIFVENKKGTGKTLEKAIRKWNTHLGISREWIHIDIASPKQIPNVTCCVWVTWDGEPDGYFPTGAIDAEYRNNRFFDMDEEVIYPTCWMYSHKPNPPINFLLTDKNYD